jgi:hypothetical protein
MGQKSSLDFIFNYLRGSQADYMLQVEEDWILHRPLSLKRIAKVLEENPNILQMRIPRVIWNAKGQTVDLEEGSQLLLHLKMPESFSQRNTNGLDSWYEWRGDYYFWTHNPSFFHRRILAEEFSSMPRRTHEMSFGLHLLEKFPEGTSAFWASNPYEAYTTHIGFRDKKLLKRLPIHPS